MAAELSEMLQQMSLNVPPHATFNKTVPGLANIYPFESKHGAVVYRYDVEMTRKFNGEEKSLTKGGGDDGKKGLLRDICLEMVNTTFKETFGNDVLYVYDNRKNLFTDKKINPVAYEVTAEKMSTKTRTFLRNQAVYVVIQPVQKEKSHVLDLNDITSSLQRKPEEQSDHSLRTFLELLTSQPFINAGDRKIVGMGRIFYCQGQKMNNFPAITTHKGLAKGVRIIENGDKTKPVPALVADVKTCAFFTEGNLRQIADDMIQQKGPRFNRNDPKMMQTFWAEFGQLYRGISASLSYAPWRIIVIDSVTIRTCQEISIEIEGKAMTLPTYFNVKKNTRIDGRYPAVRQHIDRDSLFPLECLNILPLQRLTLDKMMGEDMGRISRDLLTANATKPDIRYAAIQQEMKLIGDPEGMSGQFMAKFGVRLKGGRNDISIGMLPLPKMKFNGIEQPQDDRGRFDIRGPTRYQYLEPSTMLTSWVIGYPRRIGEGLFNRFINDLLNAAKNRGMKLPPPKYEMIELAQMNDAMEKMGKDKVQFFFYIDNKFIKSHSQLKLGERRHKVVTQHVTIEMAQKAGGASVQNVLNKMNMKLRGLNYLPVPDPIFKSKFDLSSGNVMVIGVDSSRPPKATAYEMSMFKKHGLEGYVSEDPMVIGFCANIAQNPQKFYGDYFYQPCKQDVFDGDYLAQKMIWAFNQIKKNRGKMPTTIMVIRDGLSEGMVPNAIKGEFNSFVQSCDKFMPGWAPKFIYCIVDKRHNKRFFLKQGQKIENTMPGSVVDSKIVRIDIHEFFLQAHFPLKGCSKIPQYIIPVNQVKATSNELQAFILSLCNMWQIVNLAPALPAPVLQAKELAKRGRNNYMELKHISPQFIPRVPIGDRQQGSTIEYTKLNNMLNYESAGGLVLTRFNA